MPKININNILRGMTVTSFGMGAFNLFNNIQNRNWQTRVDALIADRESLSAKISVLQEVKIESLEHKITVEEQINKVLIALNENNKSLTSLKDYALANPSTLNPEIVNAKIEQAEKSGKMVNETANNLFNNLNEPFEIIFPNNNFSTTNKNILTQNTNLHWWKHAIQAH